MAEQDGAKHVQIADMSPQQRTETVPGVRAPVVASPAGVAPAGAEPASATSAMLEPDLQAHIGRTLRAVYDEVVNEAVPERFRQLLEDLERKQAREQTGRS
jgi:hypothetical protein